MRTGHDGGWLEVDGKVIGISLGSDFCAEHENGISGLKRTLGIDGQKPRYSREKVVYSKGPGLPRRTITQHDLVKFYEYQGSVALICNNRWWFELFEGYVKENGVARAFQDRLPHGLPKGDLGCAWSDDDFGIYGSGQNADLIRELYAAFQSNNIAMWIGGAMALKNGGLVICMVDRIPEKEAKILSDADMEAVRLDAASVATGILERLAAARKGYFACSPRWLNGKKSAHPVIYWLNPMEQDQNNYGWFTVEELDQWIAGKGPIPKAPVSAS